MNFLNELLGRSQPLKKESNQSRVPTHITKRIVPPEFSSASYDPSVPGIRVVCISDTHGMHGKMAEGVPAADLVIHAGDMTSTGEKAQLEEFVEWFDNLPHPNKVFIAGNHDITIDADYYVARGQKRFHSNMDESVDAAQYAQECRSVFTSREKSHYLEDSSIYLSTVASAAAPDGEGQGVDVATAAAVATTHLVSEPTNCTGGSNLRVYGSPWQPEFCDWAFNLQRGRDSAEVWAKIPGDTDLLITHGPPQGKGDLTSSGFACGCEDMLAVIKGMAVPPRVHVFGHIHEAYGHWTDGRTLYINASTCTFHYKATNKPIMFHLPFDRSLQASVIEY
jgi:predicted phosphodiesterase